MSFQQSRTAGTFQGAPGQVSVAQSATPVRLAFIRKVYTLFSCSMLIWAGTTALAMSNDAVLNGFLSILGTGIIGWVLFMAVMFMILRLTAASFPLNIIGLGVFALLEGLITAPFILVATNSIGLAADGVSIEAVVTSSTLAITGQAFFLTAAIFGSITAYVLTTKKDFSFMRGAVALGFGLALGLILISFYWSGAANIVGGTGFAAAMVVLFAGFMLYDTSNIVHRYAPNQAASAAAKLLLDFVIMFRFIVMMLSNRD
jgi:FtsH-binding integral membrane protein